MTATTIARALSAAGIEPREARLLLAEACGFSEASVIAQGDEELPPEVEARFSEMVARRRDSEPIAYIIGRREFYSLPLSVGPPVLIPRPETELLVDLALERIAVDQDANVLDLGTGSGAIALAIKRHRPRTRVVAVEISVAALEFAKRNAAKLGLAIEFLHGRWFEPVRSERFDVVVSNPPYVALEDPHLNRGDLRFEPRHALVAGADGLDEIRAIARDAAQFVNPAGWLLLEHGQGQEKAVQELIAAGGFDSVTTWPDLAGIARVTGGKLKSD